MKKTEGHRTKFRWTVLALIFLTYMIAGAYRANIGVVIPFIKKDFALTNTDIGAMATFFYIGYAAIQVPIGYIYSKVGTRKILAFSMVLTSLATFLIGFTSTGFQLKGARLLLGLAEGPVNIGIVGTINRWFPPREKGLATGVFMSSIKFAPAVVPPLCAYIVMQFGWREIFYIFGIPGFIISALWYWLVKDEPEESPYCSKAELDYIGDAQPVLPVAATPATASGEGRFRLLDRFIMTRSVPKLDNTRDILLSWNLWGCALGYFCIVGVVYAIMTWVPSYLINVKKFSVMNMGLVAATPWVGAVIGNIIGGLLSDRVFDLRRKPLMIITSASTVFMMYALLYAPNDPVSLGLLLFVAGVFLNLGYSTFLVYPMGLATRQKCPFAASIVNMAGSLGGAFAPLVVGMLLDAFDWDMAFTFLAGCSLCTLGIVLTIVEPRDAKPAAVIEGNVQANLAA